MKISSDILDEIIVLDINKKIAHNYTLIILFKKLHFLIVIIHEIQTIKNIYFYNYYFFTDFANKKLGILRIC